jgi:predicted TPR repeat methyltransferase
VQTLAMKHRIKCLLGASIEVALPHIAAEIDSGRSTGKLVRLKNWVVYNRLARARARGDASSVSNAHFDYWKSDVGNAFYDQYTDRFEQWFLGHHKVVIDELEKVVGASSSFQRLVEIGCGDGQVLRYCRDHLPSLQEVVGLDINPMIIERNQSAPANRGISYFHGDAMAWLAEHPKPGTVLLSYGGVLEYFSQKALSDLLALLAKNAPAVLAFVEPIDPRADLLSQKKSYMFGQEDSFSHPHRSILDQAGYQVLFEKEILLSGVRWMLMIARAGT